MSEQVLEFASLEDLLQEDISQRATGEVEIELVNGKDIKLPLQAISPDEEQAIRKRATKYVNGKRGGRFAETDDLLYNCLVIAKATDTNRTNINWNSKDLADKVGARIPAPEFIIPKFLSLGGIGTAVEAITELSGIKDTFDVQVEAAKN